jgi:hypothetical protein
MGTLGGFSEEALNLFQLAASESSYEFAEGEDMYDFTRCVRGDGSAYGTGGRCVKGTQEDKKPEEKKTKSWSPPTGKNRPPENPTAAQITAMTTDQLWDGKASYKPGTAGHQAYKNEIDRRRERDEKLERRKFEESIKAKSGVTATPGNIAKAKAAREKLAAEKKANGGKRTDRIQEEKRLARNRAEKEREAKLKANQKKQAEMDAKNKQ